MPDLELTQLGITNIRHVEIIDGPTADEIVIVAPRDRPRRRHAG